MKRSSRSHRFGLGKGVRSLLGKRRAPRELVQAAGASPEQGFEALESRQLLFTLTIGPQDINPATGIGTVQTQFAYFIPYLTPTTQPQATMPTAVVEDFMQAAPGPLPNNSIIPQPNGTPVASRLRLDYTTATAPSIVGQALRIVIAGGEAVTFSVQPTALIGLLERAGMRQFAFTVVGGTFDPNTITVDLMYAGTVTQSFTGTALALLGITGPFVFPGGNRAILASIAAPSQAFDAVRIRANAGAPAASFTLKPIDFQTQTDPFAQILQNRMYAVSYAFSGPLGASVTVQDLYGRDMRAMPPATLTPFPPDVPQETQPRTIELWLGDIGGVIRGDRNLDGIPDFNDGIGKIIMTGVNARSAITMFGGTTAFTMTPTPRATFILVDSILGFNRQFESQAGFGYDAIVTGTQVTVGGLPPGPDSIIIGSPFVRPQGGGYNPGGFAPLNNLNFSDPTQGFFIQGGASIASIYAHAILFGSSQLTGSADRVIVGQFMGSLNVAGDLGSLLSGGDSGVWVSELTGIAHVANNVGSQLTVGRTLGEFDTGGRLLSNVTVVGDLTRPALHPPRDVYRYYEKTFAQHPFNPQGSMVVGTIQNVLDNNDSFAVNSTLGGQGAFFFRAGQSLVFGNAYFRNDSILSAEWIGSAATAVEIHGEVGFGDAVNTAEIPSNIFAFPVDGTRDIDVQLNSGRNALGLIPVYMRIVDSNGRTVAAPQLSPRFAEAVTLRYHPNSPGVYYLVVTGPGIFGAPDTIGNIPYVLTVSGMAPVTAGAIRAAASIGSNATTPNTIDVLSGALGSLRIGTTFVSGGGAEIDPAVVSNPIDGQDLRQATAWLGSTVSVAGNLYNITAGGDIGYLPAIPLVFLHVTGNLGTLYTGLSSVIGTGFLEGDLNAVSFQIGGSIGAMLITGGLGMSQDVMPDPIHFPVFGLPASVVIRTGLTANLRGDVGMIRVGSRVSGDTFNLTTAPGSVVGAFLVDQDSGITDTAAGIYTLLGQGNGGVHLNLGFNSDLKFFDTPEIDYQNIDNRIVNLVRNAAPLFITDDGGAQVTIQIVGGNANAGGLIRLTPVDLSQGVAVGRIEVNLDGGASLVITGTGPGNPTNVFGIGKIIVTGADANSSININGQTQVDVWQILQTGGSGFNSITNSTPKGDIVAADMTFLNTLTIGTGNLGRTLMPAWGPQLIGPFLGAMVGASGNTGGPIGILGANLAPNNGALYRPVNNANEATPFLDDIGLPFSPYLNGLIVRTGNITSVSVGGAIGDVIAGDVSTGNGTMFNVVANADGVTPAGGFDGIVGNIYAANRIASIDIGDGLAARDPAPLATTGIYAGDDIGRIFSSNPNANIESIVIASNVIANNAVIGSFFPTDGIDSITLVNGSFINAFIGGTNADAFWTSFFAPDGALYASDVNHITTTTGNFFESQFIARTLNTMVLGGFYDASEFATAFDASRIEAQGFRNSTITGRDLEFRANTIDVGNNLGVLTTTGLIGDINDITVSVLGRITEVSAMNISRTAIRADIGIDFMHTAGSLRGSSVNAGLLTLGQFDSSIRSSEIMVSGPIINLTAADSITNTHIEVTGPDGRIDHLSAVNTFTGSIASAGPIGTIEVTVGDFIATIKTVTNIRGVPGNIDTLRAGRDLDVATDVDGNINQLIAGRHIGNINTPRVIQIQGTLTLLDASHGQLYSDLRVGQTIATVLLGAVLDLPGNSFLGHGNISAFGSIATVTIEGDFGASISSASGGIGVVTIDNGSLLPSGSITALAGSISNIIINSGHLMGTIHADQNILSIRLNGSADGAMGDIGVNPALSSGTPFDAFRNQLPPNVIATSAIDGPRITAGFNIGRIILTNGSIFEAFIWAGRAIGTIDVAAGTNINPGDISGAITRDNLTTGQATTIAAGSTINLIHAATNAVGVNILAGVKDFGADGVAGGQGANADTIRSGRITTVAIGGNATNVHVSAGMDPGPDGQYNTGDELKVPGISYIRAVTVGGVVSDVSAFSDSPTVTSSPGVVLAGTNFPNNDPDLSSGAPVPGGAITPGTPFAFTWGGVGGTILFTGSGQAYWDAVAGRVSLINTSLSTNITISTNVAGATLTNFAVVTNNNASMGLITVNAALAGRSVIDVDAYCMGITVTGDFSGTGVIKAGANLRSLVVGNFTGGFITGSYWIRDLVVNGNYGTPAVFGEARIDLLSGSTVTINGQDSALVQVERDLASFVSNGAMNRAQLRVGASLGLLTTGAMNQTRISAINLGPVTVNGDMTETTIQAGGDLGEDAAPGGTGFNADKVSAGSIASVMVLGNFTRSSIVAGALRGPDGFFGTADDIIAPGRSTIGDVHITGTATGSNLNSEQYRISSNGTLGAVTFGGQASANFQVGAIATQFRPIEVTDLQASAVANQWVATLVFNQPMNVSTIGPALTISEVRDGGATLLPLAFGTDYTLGDWNPVNNSITIIFSRDVTDRGLVAPGVPDPTHPSRGVFRFNLSASALRAAVDTARLDGNGSGFATPGNDYSQATFVGDAGDAITPSIQVINGHTVDIFGPDDLNVVLENSRTHTGLPNPNTTFTVHGAIGDNPSQDGSNFTAIQDTDFYKVTLQAGQILRLGAMQGPGQFAGRVVLSAAGGQQGGSTPDTLQLPVDPLTAIDLTQQDAFLIKTTGVYYIQVGLGFATGAYSFTVQVFDDGNTGFNAGTHSGNGANIVNAPSPLAFAGNDGILGTADDLTSVTIGTFVFHLIPGPNGAADVANDTVTGINDSGMTSTRHGLSQLSTTINSSIGPAGHAGVPGDVAADIDVFNLNNNLPITPGTLITVKVKLADLGADLGSFSQLTNTDFRGSVQFGLFDTTDSTGIGDGLLVFSPKDFLPRSSTQRLIAHNGQMAYGYDANGDFYITFIAPDHIGGQAGQAAKLSIYLQGVFNTDYSLVVTQTEGATLAAIPQDKQNVFLETRGGVINWLQAGGISTKLLPFASSVLGFTGNVGGVPVDQYITTHLVSTLQAVFTATGLNVVVSADPSAFEFQDFSTVFLTSSNDPTTILTSDTFGYSQHSDPYNLDHNDQGVVFLPAFATLGYTPTQADVDAFVQSLTAAVGRRVGELMGLRITTDSLQSDIPIDIMSANSPANTPNSPAVYGFTNTARNLSDGFDVIDDTNFFLGQQNAFALLDKFVAH